MKQLALAVALALAFASTSAAQLLRGTVRDSASGTAIPGAVLVLLDAAGATLGRNITNERGQYTIVLSNGMREVRVLRIGFRPRVARIPDPVDGIARLDIAMASIPTLLQPVSVIDQPNCPRRNDATAAFALWEQAKSALLATVVAREANPADILRLHYDRQLAPSGDQIRHLEVRVESASTTRPFAAARSATEFIARGFVDDTAGVRLYHAPDADVMLDDAFPRGYCFSLAAADRSRPREIGLAFKAASSKRGRVDIDGVVWIDSVSRALSDIVYAYRGLGAAIERLEPGGRTSFRTMDNGSVLIDRWFIRIISPAVERTGTRLTSGWDIHEKGGEVARARWADGREWLASLGTIEGRAFHRAKPAANARLLLVDTDYHVVTDSTGAFKIPHLLPGPYEVAVVDSTLEPLDLTLRTNAAFTAVRDSATSVLLQVPTARDYVAAACQAKGRVAGEFSVVGRAVKPDSSPAPFVDYDVSVFRLADFQQWDEGQANERGVFVVCRVERDQQLELKVSADGRRGSDRLRVAKRIETITITLKNDRDDP